MRTFDLRSVFRSIISGIQELYSVLGLLKIQLILALDTTVLLLVPAQILEIYRLLFEDFSGRWPQALLAIIGLGFLTFMLWYSGRWMTLTISLTDLNAATFRTGLLRWLPRLLAILPGLALGLFLTFSPESIDAQDGAAVSIYLRLSGLAILGLTLLFLVWTMLRTRLMGNAGSYEAGVGSFGTWAVRTAQFMPLVMLLLVVISPIQLPEFVGTLFFVSVFIALIAFLLSSSSLFFKRTGFPLTMTMAGLVILWSVLDINDNHAVRTVKTKGGGVTLQVERAFELWLHARPDFAAYRDRGLTYPVYIVAAEGGGIYAAHHSASFLARAQDLCPGFSRHVFAISGISGGSLGSSVFTGLIRDPKNSATVATGSSIVPCKISDGTMGPLESAADRIFSRDLLSPLVAATLAKDVPQRFWPIAVGSFDRARALEDAVKAAWDREQLTKGLLNIAVSDAWSPAAVVPALVLNTTHVETGQRVATSPFQLVWSGSGVDTIDRYLEDGEGLSLVSAAILSARFTYITPAGTMYLNSDFLDDGDQPQKVRLVDGGYFENSGVDTAMDIIEAVRPIARAAGAEIRLISLQYWTERSEANHFLAETFSPIRALLATRVRRGRLATERADTRMTGFCPLSGETTSVCDDFTDINDPVRVSVIHDREGNLPLGWLLSEKSRRIIGRQIGWPHLCNYLTGYVGPDSNGADSVDHDNDCLMKFFQIELESGIPASVQMPDWN